MDQRFVREIIIVVDDQTLSTFKNIPEKPTDGSTEGRKRPTDG